MKKEALLPLFDEVKGLLAPYAERLTVRGDGPGYVELWPEWDIEIDVGKRGAVFFCGLMVQT